MEAVICNLASSNLFFMSTGRNRTTALQKEKPTSLKCDLKKSEELYKYL